MANVNINLRKNEDGDPAIKFETEDGDYLDTAVKVETEINGDEYDEEDAEAIKEEIRQMIMGHLLKVSGAMMQGDFSEEDT